MTNSEFKIGDKVRFKEIENGSWIINSIKEHEGVIIIKDKQEYNIAIVPVGDPIENTLEKL